MTLDQAQIAAAAADPRIGVLCRQGRPVFYAYAQGHAAPETCGTLPEVLAALKPAQAPASKPAKARRPPAPHRDISAILTSPEGERSRYTVSARNRTEARKAIGDLFRRDTPPKSAGFYTFAQCRLEWSGEGEE